MEQNTLHHLISANYISLDRALSSDVIYIYIYIYSYIYIYPIVKLLLSFAKIINFIQYLLGGTIFLSRHRSAET